MTSLLEQKESLLRLQKDTAKQIAKINRELIYENKEIEDLEQFMVEHIDEISNILTYLRDNYKKKYKLFSSYTAPDDCIDIKLLEHGGAKNGYSRYIEKIETE
jgi:hypothetical protein